MAYVDVRTDRVAGHLVVVLYGELDICDTAWLARALSAAAASGMPIVVDLAGVTYMDCSSLSVLASVRTQALRAGGDLLLARPQESVSRLLCLTGIAELPDRRPMVPAQGSPQYAPV